MLDNTLVHLMEYIRRASHENISVWKIFPEWMDNWTETGISACSVKCCWIIISKIEDVKSLIYCAEIISRVWTKISKFFSGCRAPWAVTIECCSDENLLWIVTNKYGIDWMTTPPYSISGDHGNTTFGVFLEWSNNTVHTGMEQITQCSPAGSFVGNMV